MSAGLRDQVLRHYARQHETVDGVVTATYLYQDWLWGRIEPPTGREQTVGAGPEYRIDGILQGDEVFVPDPDDLILDDAGQVWEIRAVLPRRLTADTQLWLERGRQPQSRYQLLEPEVPS